MFWVEAIISTLMGTIGGYLMYRGKKIQEPKMILWGGVLIVLSYFLFSAGSKDDATTKAALNMVIPSAAATDPAQ
jgi:ammonia channel protein AmtB